MTDFSLSDSYAYCQQLAKKTARNFYYSFLGLRKEQFQAMCVLYAYMRTVDDLGDQTQCFTDERVESLKQWRMELQNVLQCKQIPKDQIYDPCFPALLDVIQRYEI
ncbi:squalene/phytoene synthase family protein, partial [uncultured Gimesia sp.]|uniref:squalene/phytoene synthase family protein n=1 Tax=uncultured Gimesia sp. TaxID=1678688 RepID=UPI002624AB26